MGKDFKVFISQTEMSDEMQNAAAEVLAEASNRYNNLIDISKYIKTSFEKEYGNTWQCIVGRSFSR